MFKTTAQRDLQHQLKHVPLPVRINEIMKKMYTHKRIKVILPRNWDEGKKKKLIGQLGFVVDLWRRSKDKYSKDPITIVRSN